MPSSYTSNLGIELPADGELDGIWGDVVNDNMSILDRAINGTITLSLSGTSSTLTTTDGTLSDGQYKLLVLGGTPSGTHTITIAPNDAQKIYFVRNTTAQSVVFTQGSGGNVTIASGDSGIIYSNGGGAGAAVVNLTDHFAMNSVSITGGTITGITDLAVADGGTGASDAATARTNLGLGTIATQNSSSVSITGGSVSGITDLAVADGGTGASDAAGARTNLGLGTIATQNSASVSITGGSITGITDIAVADGGTGSSTAAGARTNLGLAIGTDVQAYDADLAAIAALAVTDGNFIVGNGTTWVAESGATARTSLGLGTMATQNSASVSITGGSISGITDLAVADGGTGASDAATARTNLGAQATITGAATSITSSNLTASRALSSDGSGKVAASSVTSTELGYLSGVTSAIQTQLNTKAPSASPTLTSPTLGSTITITGGTQNWTVAASGGNLTFAYNGVNLMRLDSSGNITVVGNVTAYGTL